MLKVLPRPIPPRSYIHQPSYNQIPTPISPSILFSITLIISSMSSSPQSLSHSNIIIEASCIIRAYKGHFLALTFLFFFPLWFSIVSLPSFIRTTTILNQSKAALSSLYALFVFSLSIAGIATVTHSTKEAYFRRPLNLLSTIKSLPRSFVPLSSTILTFAACLTLICIIPLLGAGSILHAIGFEIIYSSYLSIGCFAFAFSMAGLFIIFCQVYCLQAGVIAVVESKSGFQPSRQNYYLIKEMKWDFHSSLFLHGIVIWITFLGSSYPILFFLQSQARISYWDVIKISVTCIFEGCLSVQVVAAATLLYLNCNDLQREFGIEIEDETSSREYTSLSAMDDHGLAQKFKVRTALLVVAWMILTTALLLNGIYVQ